MSARENLPTIHPHSERWHSHLRLTAFWSCCQAGDAELFSFFVKMYFSWWRMFRRLILILHWTLQRINSVQTLQPLFLHLLLGSAINPYINVNINQKISLFICMFLAGDISQDQLLFIIFLFIFFSHKSQASHLKREWGDLSGRQKIMLSQRKPTRNIMLDGHFVAVRLYKHFIKYSIMCFLHIAVGSLTRKSFYSLFNQKIVFWSVIMDK